MITTLTVLLGSLMISATANGEWKAHPAGHTLSEPSIVGSIQDGRVLVEKTKGLEARVDATEEALMKIEDQVKIMSAAMAESQKQIEQIPDLIKKVEADFAKTLKREKAKSTTGGITIGLILGGAAALIF